MAGKNRKVLAVDMDEVLVMMAVPWVLRAVADATAWSRPWAGELYREFGNPLDVAKLTAAVMARPQRHVQTWLMEGFQATEADVAKFTNVYRRDPHFYDDLQPTHFAGGLAESVRLMPHTFLAVHVISHCFALTDAVQDSKKRWLDNWLPEGPTEGGVMIRHHLVDRSKAEVMAEFCPEVDAFVDDDIRNHEDVLAHWPRVKATELLVPRYGYNKASDAHHELARLRQSAFAHYDGKV